MLTLILRPLAKLAFNPTVASAAAAWGITALQGNVTALEQAKAELEETIAERQRQLADLDAAVAERLDAEPVTESFAELAERVCHNSTPHPAHRWHDVPGGMAEAVLRDCPGLPE